MEYTVLARRFRPQSFGEVVGQEMISQALRNAIASERVAHAYLFTGARGVGKTSTARILAKSLNCPNAKHGDPCNQCEICSAISTGSDVDVLEIDGASNRGIDEIRDLRANVNIKPMRCRYKIYIIDEVHMLTTPAFNALLKTLEEPPANVKFIFCTTEPEKVPDTILSRCQRFDFGTIATATIKQRLAEIATAEGIEVDSAALELVARRAAGSMRDSQSLFDQLLAFGGKSIGAADVHRLLGTAPDDRLLDLVESLVSRDRKRALELFHTALDTGAQLGELTDQLLACLRDLMVLAAGAADAGLLSLGDEQRPVLAKKATAWGLPSILAALQILAEARARMKGVSYGRILAELALVRIASLEDLVHLGELVAAMKAGKLPASSGPGSAANQARAPSAAGGSPNPARHATEPAPMPRSAPGNTTSTTPTTVRPPDHQPPEQVVSADPPGDDRPIPSVAPVSTIPLEAGRENELWMQALDILDDTTKWKARKASSLAISGPNQVVLTFPKCYDTYKNFFERSAENFGLLEAAITRVVSRPVKILFAIDETGGAESSERDVRPSREDQERNNESALSDPLVQRALAAFGATLVKVEAISDSSTK